MLATKVPDRKFDFSLDYRVINELGAALYARARIELPVTSPERREYLQKTIAAYRRTLAIDSEDVSAHYGLGQAYGDPAWGDKTAVESAGCEPDDGDKAEPVDADALVKLAASIADPKRRRDRAPDAGVAPGTRHRRGSWTARARATSRGWSRFTSCRDPWARLGRARPTPKLRPRWRKPWKSRTTGCTNGSSPTRPPRAGPFALARQRDPAANHNAQSIVIHSLHRPGAPGIDQPVASGLARTIHRTTDHHDRRRQAAAPLRRTPQ